MKSFAFFCVFVLVVCEANPTFKDDASDQYIDKVLENLKAVIVQEGLDPAPLPPGEVKFSETILGITFHGSATVYDGFFGGLSTILRNGDTSFSFDPTSNNLKLTAHVGLEDATAGYKARAEFMDIGIGASADARIRGVDVYFEADMCVNEGCSLQLTKFDITDLGDIEVHFDGLGPLDWILDLVVDLVGGLIKDWLADILEGPIKDLLQGILDEMVPDIPKMLA